VRPSDAEVAVAAAEAGAAIVRARFGTSLTRVAKAPMDFATDVDVGAEQAILDVLRAARPADAYLGEELGTSGNGSADRLWLIDPLCGTVNFAAQTPMMAVNVALRDGSRTGAAAVAAAAVAAPLAGEVFWTDGQQAFLRRNGTDTVISPSADTRLVDINLDPPHPNGTSFLAARMLADPAFMRAFRPRVSATSLPLAWVAAGRRGAYVTDGHLRDNVHFSAGIALCQAAGCVISGLRGQPLYTGSGGLVAGADRQAHAALIEIIGEQFTR
jgi:myo-inositol-1(or 4)-monophosphatase